MLADDVNLIGGDIRTIERNAKVSLNASKDIGLAVDRGKTKYMEIGHHRGMIANEHIRIDSNSYEIMKSFKYLDSLVTYQNSIQEEIKCKLKTLLSSRLPSKNLKIKIYKTIILPVVLYGCEAWSLTLREKHSLSVFENRILR